jgi:hypothetical protein
MKKVTILSIYNKKGEFMGNYEETIPEEKMKKVKRYGWEIHPWTLERYETKAELVADLEAWDESFKPRNDTLALYGY